ncbi:hypothetical protein GGTG_04688 [Gaeumannomyces tritici R3-111a-1]|uniref:Uncharacterized protein n=1 Tax=Gaeumannomyces tritici (strain R3-111a-1) TaxID=644352 RepID=J3NTT9_GAET3|nr:hypothetical protein GGTG_04688 [Gaeumannomyces tritici R3-111a-1]EJT79604.1 hypothetical protein GGTG_04688 [Gaeumannomyces tritici R3-111a-1]
MSGSSLRPIREDKEGVVVGTADGTNHTLSDELTPGHRAATPRATADVGGSSDSATAGVAEGQDTVPDAPDDDDDDDAAAAAAAAGSERDQQDADGGIRGAEESDQPISEAELDQLLEFLRTIRNGEDMADLEEFSHLVVYDDIPEGGQTSYPPNNHDLALRERELAIRQRELALKKQEMRMRRGPLPGPPRRGPTPSLRGQPHGGGGFNDDDEDDDYFDPTGPPTGLRIDPDNLDMMSVTSKKNRRIPSASNSRKPD